MRVRSAHLRLLAVAALLAPLAVPGAARASDTEIVVAANRSAYVDIDVREALQFQSFDFGISKGGLYVGLVIEPFPWSMESARQTTVIAFRADGLDGRAVRVASRGQIEPGRYRVWILGDHRPRVVIPVMRGGFEIRPVNKVRSRLLAPRASDVLAGISRSEHRYDRSLSAGWSALVGMRVTGQRAVQGYICASESESCRPPTLPLYVPSTDESTGAGFIRPAQQLRHLIAGTEGVRVSSGELHSLALTFTT